MLVGKQGLSFIACHLAHTLTLYFWMSTFTGSYIQMVKPKITQPIRQSRKLCLEGGRWSLTWSFIGKEKRKKIAMIDNEELKILLHEIEEFLELTASREMFSADEVQDKLLDFRALALKLEKVPVTTTY